MTDKNDDAITSDDVLSSYRDCLRSKGLDEETLARHRKQQLYAKETKFLKLKGEIRDDRLPFRVKKVATSMGTKEDETLLKVDMIAWGIRQRASDAIENLLGIGHKDSTEFSGKIIIEHQIPEPAPLPEFLQKQVDEQRKREGGEEQ